MEMSFHPPPPSDCNREYEFSKMIPECAICESPSMLQIHEYFGIHFSLFLRWLKKLISRKYDSQWNCLHCKQKYNTFLLFQFVACWVITVFGDTFQYNALNLPKLANSPCEKGNSCNRCPEQMRNKRGDSRKRLSSILLHHFLFWSISWKSAQLSEHFEIDVCIWIHSKTTAEGVQRPSLPIKMTWGCTLCDRGSNTRRYFMERALPHGLGLKIHLTPQPGWWLGSCSVYSGSFLLHRTPWEGSESSSSAQPLSEYHSKLFNYLYKQKKKEKEIGV